MYVHIYARMYVRRAGPKKREVNRNLRHILVVIRNCESYT